AGIESPGLTSCPAIGETAADILKEKMWLEKKEHFIETRKGILDPNTLATEEHAELIRKETAYGNVSCRCEQITEGEILDAIHHRDSRTGTEKRHVRNYKNGRRVPACRRYK